MAAPYPLILCALFISGIKEARRQVRAKQEARR
jgi:hypothetical protein